MIDPGSPAVRIAFLERLHADLAADSVRPLDFYQSVFPGHEESVAQAYREVVGTDDRERDGAAVETGRIGDYRVLNVLGRGGQAVVYLAEDERLNRRVALKVLTGLGQPSADALGRFRREAELLARLQHSGVCTVHEAGSHAGVPYLVLELIEGEPLDALLDRAGHRPPTDGEPTGIESALGARDRASVEVVLQFFERAAEALHAAHDAGVLHRDIKPGNIMVSADGSPVLMDFGLAREETATSLLTQEGDIFGTPAYMSPEQVLGDGDRIDRRSDLYSLGTALYESLTLKRPFDAPTRTALFRHILFDLPPDARGASSAIGRDLAAVLDRLLEKSPDRRYDTAQEVAEELRRVRERRPVRARPLSAFGRVRRWSRRHPARAGLVLTLLLLVPAVSGLGGFLFANWDKFEAQDRAEHRARVERHVLDGFLALMTDDSTVARRQFEQARAAERGEVEALAGLALVELRFAGPDACLAWLDRTGPHLDIPALRRIRDHLEDANRTDPMTPLDWFIDGHLALAIGDMPGIQSYERALACFKEACDLSPRRRLLHFVMRAVAAWKARDREELEKVLSAIDQDPAWRDAPAAWLARAMGLTELGRNAEAIEAGFEILRLGGPDLPYKHVVECFMGYAAARLGRSADRREWTERALRTRWEYPIAQSNLADTYLNEGDVVTRPQALRARDRDRAAAPVRPQPGAQGPRSLRARRRGPQGGLRPDHHRVPAGSLPTKLDGAP